MSDVVVLSSPSIGPPQWRPLVAWAANTAYFKPPWASAVYYDGSLYECRVDHTSGTDFAADLAAERWQIAVSAQLTAEWQAIVDANFAAAEAANATAQAAVAATAADREKTGLDVAATGGDRVQTGLDRIATAGYASVASTHAKRYATLSAANADIGAMAVNDSAEVFSDGANNGTYYKASSGASSLTKMSDATVPSLASGKADTGAVAPWLHQDAVSMVGLAAGSAWTAGARAVASAILDVVVWTQIPGKTYRLTYIGRNNSTNKYRIIVKDEAGTNVADTSSSYTVTEDTVTGINRIDVWSSIAISLWIDYRRLASGTYYDLTAAPLWINATWRGGQLAKADTLPRVRNTAFDGALAKGSVASSFPTVSGSGATAAVAADTYLAALGVTNAFDISTGTTVTGRLKQETLPANMAGKWVFNSALVSSSDGGWPTGAYTQQLYNGASLVTAERSRGGYIQINDNVRQYWSARRVPAGATVTTVRHGFTTGLVSASASAQFGGYTLGVSESVLTPDNVNWHDWLGYTSTDAWRDSVDATLAASASYPYYNRLTNANFDAAGPALPVVGAPVYATPTSAQMVADGIKRVIKLGNGAPTGANTLVIDKVLAASSASKYYFTSARVYSGDGTTWPALRTYWYTASASVGNVQMTSYIVISANERVYYATGQLPNNASLNQVRIGSITDYHSSGVDLEYGGLTFVLHTAALTYATVKQNQWYERYLQPETLARAITSPYTTTFSSKIGVIFGDSIMQSYGVPDALAPLLGSTILNFAKDGSRWTKLASASGEEVYKQYLAVVSLAQTVASGDYSTLLAQMDAYYASGYAVDWRAQAAAMAALDWSTVGWVLIAASTNDYSGNIPLGSATSTTDTEFYGAINLALTALQTKMPSVPIFLAQPAWRGPLSGYGDSNVNTNGIGLKLRDYGQCLSDRGLIYGAPVIDLQRSLGINLANKATFLNNSDDLHPTTSGAARWADRLAGGMRAAVA